MAGFDDGLGARGGVRAREFASEVSTCLHVWLVVPLTFNRMLWAELFSPKIHVKVLTPGILERDPVWKWVFAEVINESGHEGGA